MWSMLQRIYNKMSTMVKVRTQIMYITLHLMTPLRHTGSHERCNLGPLNVVDLNPLREVKASDLDYALHGCKWDKQTTIEESLTSKVLTTKFPLYDGNFSLRRISLAYALMLS
jgi:hypothetical protein